MGHSPQAFYWGTIPYVVGSELYPGCLHCFQPIGRSSAIQLLFSCVAGALASWRSLGLRSSCEVQRSSQASCQMAAIFVLGGDIEPNPGPKSKLRPRRLLDLGVGFANVTADHKKRCLTAFEAWVSCELGIPWNKIEQDPDAFCFALRAYGLHCF